MRNRLVRLFTLNQHQLADPALRQRALGIVMLAWASATLFIGWIALIAIPAFQQRAEGYGAVFIPLLGGVLLVPLIFYAIRTGRLTAAAWGIVLFTGAAIAPPVLTQFDARPMTLAMPALVLLPVVVAGVLLERRDHLAVLLGVIVLLGVRAYVQSTAVEVIEVIPAQATERDALQLAAAVGMVFLYLFLFYGYGERLVRASQRDLAVLRGVSAYLPAVAGSQSEQALVTMTVNLVREQLEYSTAQLFLLGEDGTLIRRIQSGLGTRETGAGLLVSEIDREIVAAVARAKQPLLTTLADENSSHLIPPARSALDLPVMAGEAMLGVLNVQSARGHFSEQETIALANLAAQLGALLAQQREFDNLRLVVRDQAQARALEGGQQRAPSLPAQERVVGFDLYHGDEGIVLTPVAGLPPRLQAAFQQSEPVIETRGNEQQVHVPIRFRGETLGVMSFTLPRNQPLGERQMTLIRTVSDRLGQALENTRLFEQTQAQAFRERKASEVANTLIGATDVRSVLERAAETFNEALGAVSTRITLQPDLGEDRMARARGELS